MFWCDATGDFVAQADRTTGTRQVVLAPTPWSMSVAADEQYVYAAAGGVLLRARKLP